MTFFLMIIVLEIIAKVYFILLQKIYKTLSHLRVYSRSLMKDMRDLKVNLGISIRNLFICSRTLK